MYFSAIAFAIKKKLPPGYPFPCWVNGDILFPANNEFKLLVEKQNYILLLIPRCSMNQIGFFIEMGIGYVEIGFTVDFTFQCVFNLTGLLQNRHTKLATAWNYLVDLLLKIRKFVALYLECIWLLPENQELN